MRQHEQDIKRGGRIILREGGHMARFRFLAPVLAALVVCSILASGCTGEKGVSQPPASVKTMPTSRPA